MSGKIVSLVIFLFFLALSAMVWHVSVLKRDLALESALTSAHTGLQTLLVDDFRRLTLADEKQSKNFRHSPLEWKNMASISTAPIDVEFFSANQIAKPDSFQERAWHKFQEEKTAQNYSEVNEDAIEYAIPWRFENSCGSCHSAIGTSSLAGIFIATTKIVNLQPRKNEIIKSTIVVYGFILILGFICVILFIIKQKQNNDALTHLTATDPLTGLFNKNELFVSLIRETQKVKRGGKSLCLISFDVDGFKQINDTLGHIKGDEILRYIGNLLPGVLRAFDIPCRFAGDEFCVILPGCELNDARRIAERIVESLHQQFPDVDLSMGIAQSNPTQALSDLELLEKANANKETAKLIDGSSINPPSN